MIKARKECGQVITKLLINQALKCRENAAVNYTFSAGDFGYAYWKTDKGYNRYSVMKVEIVQVLVIKDNKKVHSNVVQCIPSHVVEEKLNSENVAHDSMATHDKKDDVDGVVSINSTQTASL